MPTAGAPSDASPGSARDAIELSVLASAVVITPEEDADLRNCRVSAPLRWSSRRATILVGSMLGPCRRASASLLLRNGLTARDCAS